MLSSPLYRLLISKQGTTTETNRTLRPTYDTKKHLTVTTDSRQNFNEIIAKII